MFVSSVGYLMGNADNRAYAELGKARASNVANRGLNSENNKSKSNFVRIINKIIGRITNPEIKNSQNALDMIA